MPQLKKKLSSDQSEAALTQLNNCTFFISINILQFQRITGIPRFIVLYSSVFLNKLWLSCVKQVYWYHFSTSICSLQVSEVILSIFQTFTLLFYLLW